jgi:hypothetical protein
VGKGEIFDQGRVRLSTFLFLTFCFSTFSLLTFDNQIEDSRVCISILACYSAQKCPTNLLSQSHRQYDCRYDHSLIPNCFFLPVQRCYNMFSVEGSKSNLPTVENAPLSICMSQSFCANENRCSSTSCANMWACYAKEK